MLSWRLEQVGDCFADRLEVEILCYDVILKTFSQLVHAKQHSTLR